MPTKIEPNIGKAAPSRLASEINPVHFDTAYFCGIQLWEAEGIWACVTAPYKDEAWPLGLWKGYCDARYQIQRTFSFAPIEAYNEVVLQLDGEIEPLIMSRISLVDFTLGYLEGMQRGKRLPQKEALDNECAFDMGLRKARMDIYRNCDRSQNIVVAYNEVERECRRLGLTNYGWRSRTPMTREEADALGLDTFEFTPEHAAWSWIWSEETTASGYWEKTEVAQAVA